jgi:hypothetical protein
MNVPKNASSAPDNSMPGESTPVDARIAGGGKRSKILGCGMKSRMGCAPKSFIGEKRAHHPFPRGTLSHHVGKPNYRAFAFTRDAIAVRRVAALKTRWWKVYPNAHSREWRRCARIGGPTGPSEILRVHSLRNLSIQAKRRSIPESELRRFLRLSK